MLGIISGLKRSTEGGIGKIYLGLLGSNLYSTPFTSCTIVFANSGSRFKRFKSIKRVQPSIGISRLLSSKTFTNASLLSLATKGTLSIITIITQGVNIFHSFVFTTYTSFTLCCYQIHFRGRHSHVGINIRRPKRIIQIYPT